MRILSLLLLLSCVIINSITGQSFSSDCLNPVRICSNNAFTVATLPANPELISNSAENKNVCFPEKPFSETNSIWLSWKVFKSGTLTFTILPEQPDDDVDFILYRVNQDNLTCNDYEIVRCMRAGPILGNENEVEKNYCTNSTGLLAGAGESRLPVGCSETNENFLSEVLVEEGERYILLINNYLSSDGFTLKFGDDFLPDPSYGGCLNIADLNNTSSQSIWLSNIFPNPATDKINFDISCMESGSCVAQVVAMNGRIEEEYVFELSKGLEKYSVAVENLPDGIYFLRILTESGVVIKSFYKS